MRALQRHFKGTSKALQRPSCLFMQPWTCRPSLPAWSSLVNWAYESTSVNMSIWEHFKGCLVCTCRHGHVVPVCQHDLMCEPQPWWRGAQEDVVSVHHALRHSGTGPGKFCGWLNCVLPKQSLNVDWFSCVLPKQSLNIDSVHHALRHSSTGTGKFCGWFSCVLPKQSLNVDWFSCVLPKQSLNVDSVHHALRHSGTGPGKFCGWFNCVLPKQSLNVDWFSCVLPKQSLNVDYVHHALRHSGTGPGKLCGWLYCVLPLQCWLQVAVTIIECWLSSTVLYWNNFWEASIFKTVDCVPLSSCLIVPAWIHIVMARVKNIFCTWRYLRALNGTRCLYSSSVRDLSHLWLTICIPFP